MSEPKFLRTTARVTPAAAPAAGAKRKPGRPPGPGPKKTKAELKREERVKARHLTHPVKPILPPPEALTTLSEAWHGAQAAQLAGTPVESPISQMILGHLERTENRNLSPAARAAEIIEAEGGEPLNTQDQLVARHRVDIAETRRIVMALIAELDAAIVMEDLFLLIADVVAHVDAKGKPDKINKLRDRFQEMVGLTGRTDLALKLSNALRALIPLERQAAGLPDGYVDAATQRAQKESQAVATVVATSFDAIKGRFDQIMMRVQKPAAPS